MIDHQLTNSSSVVSPDAESLSGQPLAQCSEIATADSAVNISTSDSQTPARTEADIQNWIVSYIAELMAIAPDQIDIGESFDGFGMDSAAAIALTGDLENWLGYRLDPTLLYDYPTIKGLAQYLANFDSASV